MNAGVAALAMIGPDLCAGAYGLGAASIGRWDGSGWSGFGSGMNNYVYALAADGIGHLFVGGMFTLAGTNQCHYIAQANVASAPAFLRPPLTQTAEMGATVDFGVSVPSGDMAYELFFNGTNLLCYGSDNCLELTNVSPSQSGAYTVVITNFLGAATSSPVMLNVISPVERRPAAAIKAVVQGRGVLNVDYANSITPAPNWTRLGSAMPGTPPMLQYFFDVSQPLPQHRFYRASQSAQPILPPVLDVHLVPAITLTGGIGGSVRLDYINQFGPTDAWVTLATVTLTNTSQFYFDISAPGQPQRLYRLVQSP
jgi:hypothetical protein